MGVFNKSEKSIFAGYIPLESEHLLLMNSTHIREVLANVIETIYLCVKTWDFILSSDKKISSFDSFWIYFYSKTFETLCTWNISHSMILYIDRWIPLQDLSIRHVPKQPAPSRQIRL